MEIDQMRAFLAIVRQGTFSQAARDLNVTQPALSIKIRRLEEELEQVLLERRPRGVSLTPAGEIVLRRAEHILGELSAMQAELGDLSSLRSGRVALGASDTVCIYLLPEIIRRFTVRYPRIELQLFTQISHRVLELIRADQIDLGIVTMPVESEGIEIRELYQDAFILVFPPNHPWAGRKLVRPEELRQHPIIHLKPETHTRRWLDEKLEPWGLKDQIRLEVSTIEVIKRLVEAGLGISFLPQMSVADELRTERLASATVNKMKLIRSMALAYRREKYFSLALTTFVEELSLYTSGI